MHRDLHFPTPIYISDIKHPTLNQELERDIVAWSNKDKGITRTNVQGWHSTTNMAELPQFKKLVDMLYACQKTKVGEGYHFWHCENAEMKARNRILAFMVYLNDVNEGGETEFLYQKCRFKPEKNTMLVWPSQFTHVHRGNPPLSNDKYIITGWVEYGY